MFQFDEITVIRPDNFCSVFLLGFDTRVRGETFGYNSFLVKKK